MKKKNNGWISVKDRLPSILGKYITHDEYGVVGILEYVMGFHKNVRVWVDHYGTACEVTHWQPLPEPPERE